MSEAVDLEFDENSAEEKPEGFARAGSEQDAVKGEIPRHICRFGFNKPGLERLFQENKKLSNTLSDSERKIRFISMIRKLRVVTGLLLATTISKRSIWTIRIFLARMV